MRKILWLLLVLFIGFVFLFFYDIYNAVPGETLTGEIIAKSHQGDVLTGNSTAISPSDGNVVLTPSSSTYEKWEFTIKDSSETPVTLEVTSSTYHRRRIGDSIDYHYKTGPILGVPIGKPFSME